MGVEAVTFALAIADEVLTEAEAVRRVPGRDAEVRAWLRDNVRARRGPTGIRVYRWAEVLAALPLLEEPAAEPLPVCSDLCRQYSWGKCLLLDREPETLCEPAVSALVRHIEGDPEG